MIDKRIGQRFKQCREKLGLTQEEFAKNMGVTINYISTIERGMTFPRCEKLVQLLNALGVPADAVFCDVLTSSPDYQTSVLSKKLENLPVASQQRILQVVELMIQQEQDAFSESQLYEIAMKFANPFALKSNINDKRSSYYERKCIGHIRGRPIEGIV